MSRSPVLAQLLKLKKAASFERANFGTICDNPPGMTGDQLDALVKERTRIYMDTWVRPLIVELIEYQDGKISANQLTAARFP